MTLEELAHEVQKRYYMIIGENTTVYSECSPLIIVISHQDGEMYIVDINESGGGWFDFGSFETQW